MRTAIAYTLSFMAGFLTMVALAPWPPGPFLGIALAMALAAVVTAVSGVVRQ